MLERGHSREAGGAKDAFKGPQFVMSTLSMLLEVRDLLEDFTRVRISTSIWTRFIRVRQQMTLQVLFLFKSLYTALVCTLKLALMTF